MRNWGSRRHNDSQTVPVENMRRGMSKMVRPGIFFVNRAPIFIIILAFLFNVIIPQDLAWAEKTDTMPSPIGEEPSVGPGQFSLLGPNDIEIPPLFGTVKERFQQDREPKGLVVHIQDLHTHYQAHKNIASIIEHLAKKHNIDVILCEAKKTDRGFAYLRPWTKEVVRKKVAEENLKKGILTGWEALDLTSDLDLVLQGIEDKNLYMKDMDSFLKAEVFRKDALKFVDLLKNIAENLKLHVYSRAQKAFDERMKSYRDEKIGIQEYTNYLTGLADKRDINYKKFSNLGILLKTLDLEKRIDFKKAEREREDIIEVVAKRLLDEEMKKLLDMSFKFKANRISQNEFYQYLLKLSKKLDISMKRYPHFNLYTEYIATYHELDASSLFEEINNLENSLADAIFIQEDQNRLFKISKNLIILKGLVDFKLTPDEFDYYSRTKTGFDIANWLEFLRLNSEYFKLTQYVPADASIIEDNLATLENFYQIAHQRDEAFVKNIGLQFDKRNINTAFLMTGGFHTPGVTRRLKEAGYSYVVISPRIEEEMDYQKYHKILKESYKKLKETKVLAAWHACEMPNEVLKDIVDGAGVRAATGEELTSRIAIAGVIAGEGVVQRGVYDLSERGLFDLDEFFRLVHSVRQGEATFQQMRKLLEMVEVARASIYKGGPEAGMQPIPDLVERFMTERPADMKAVIKQLVDFEAHTRMRSFTHTTRDGLLKELTKRGSAAVIKIFDEELARAREEAGIEGPKARQEIRRASTEEEFTTVVGVDKGAVGVTPVEFDEEGRPLTKTEREVVLGPGESATFGAGDEFGSFKAMPPLTPEALEIVGRVAGKDVVIDTLKATYMEIDEAKIEGVVAEFEDKTDYVVELDGAEITGDIADLRRHEEAVRRYLSDFLVEHLPRWKNASDKVYFDIVGTDAELVKELRRIYNTIPVVVAFPESMRLYHEVVEKGLNSKNVRKVTISHELSELPIKNPRLYIQERVLGREALNFFNWNRSIYASFLMAVGIKAPEEMTVETIGTALEDPDSIYSKLQREFARLTNNDLENITAEVISHLYAHPEEISYKKLDLRIKPVQAVNFDEMKEIHEMLKYVEFSI